MKNFKVLAILLFTFCGSESIAQINPLDVQFFQNRYLANPAMAGFEKGIHLNLSYRDQWSSMPGSPRDQNVTFDSKLNKVGLGLSIKNNKAGLLNYTQVTGTYAYHLQLNSNEKALHMGINLGVVNAHFKTESMIGDPDDPDLVNFNERKTVIDADFGIAYTSKSFGMEAAFYKAKSQIRNEIGNSTDHHTSYLAADYTFPISDWTLKSKLAYRGVKNYTDVVDLGLNALMANEKLGLTAIYHTNKSTSLGISYLHNNKWQLLSLYNTSAQPISSYASGSFEVGLKICFE